MLLNTEQTEPAFHVLNWRLNRVMGMVVVRFIVQFKLGVWFGVVNGLNSVDSIVLNTYY